MLLHTQILVRQARGTCSSLMPETAKRTRHIPQSPTARTDRAWGARPGRGSSGTPSLLLPFALSHTSFPFTQSRLPSPLGPARGAFVWVPFLLGATRPGGDALRPTPSLLLLLLPRLRGGWPLQTQGRQGVCCFQRLVTDSDLDASSQYPSHGSLTAPATRPTVETRGVA